MIGKRVLIGLPALILTLTPYLSLQAIPTTEGKGDKEPREEISRISLQVSALQCLALLKSTPDQLETLSKMARGTAPKPQARKQVQVTEKHRKTLTDLRTALLDGNDAKVASLSEEMKALHEKEPVDLDDAIEVVAPARKRMTEVLRLYNARQLATFIGSYGEEFPDPVERLLAGFNDARELTGDEWSKSRKQLVETLGWLVAGRDADAAGMVEKEAAALLDKAHDLNEEAFKKQQEDLETAAKKLVGQVEGTQVIRNLLERDLAELLSNPELPRVLGDRLEKFKSK
jgi:hypothetical protein